MSSCRKWHESMIPVTVGSYPGRKCKEGRGEEEDREMLSLEPFCRSANGSDTCCSQ